MRISDWSSDVCSSDLLTAVIEAHGQHTTGVLQIDVQTGVIEYVLDALLHSIDQIVITGFAQAHATLPRIVLHATRAACDGGELSRAQPDQASRPPARPPCDVLLA